MGIERNSLKGRFTTPMFRAFDGRSRKVHRAECGTCQRMEEVFDNSPSCLPQEVVLKKFRQKNWEVGDDPAKDRCPDCVDRERLARRKHLRTVSVPMRDSTSIVTSILTGNTPVPDAVVTATGEMSIDDRRIIFNKLSEVYLSKDEGYATPWTDAAVAKDLGVPLKWVGDTRDQFFGPAKDSGEVRELLGKIESVAQEANAALKGADGIRTDGGNLVKRIAEFTSTVNALQRTVDALSRQADRIEKALR